MVKLTFPVSFGYSDTDVEIEVSNKDASMLKRFIEDNEWADIVDDEVMEPVVERVRKKILRGLADQVEDGEDIDVDDFDFYFDCPEFKED